MFIDAGEFLQRISGRNLLQAARIGKSTVLCMTQQVTLALADGLAKS